MLDAKFSDVSVDENIALGDFEAREKGLEGSAAAEFTAVTLPRQLPTLTQTLTTQTGTTDTTETTTTTETTETTTETETTEDDPASRA